MKTTDLYLEQVLIGFLVILIAALPWIPQLWAHSGDVKTGISIIGGSAALGFAFFIGIPFDRLADTLSERLDIRHRLKFALDYLIKPEADRKDFPVGDPFPEDMLMILCRRDQSVTRAHDYLRSRLRLTRALAVYAPAMAFIATLSVARWETAGTKVDPSTAAILPLTTRVSGFCARADDATSTMTAATVVKTCDSVFMTFSSDVYFVSSLHGTSRMHPGFTHGQPRGQNLIPPGARAIPLIQT